jgi:hypothetical protein
MGLTPEAQAAGMPLRCVDRNIPAYPASRAHLWLSQQFVDAAPVKSDDDLVADDDGRRTTALVRPD